MLIPVGLRVPDDLARKATLQAQDSAMTLNAVVNELLWRWTTGVVVLTAPVRVGRRPQKDSKRQAAYNTWQRRKLRKAA
jgi:hypothetical protein